MNLPHFFSCDALFCSQSSAKRKNQVFLTASQPKCVASRKDSKSCVHTFPQRKMFSSDFYSETKELLYQPEIMAMTEAYASSRMPFLPPCVKKSV